MQLHLDLAYHGFQLGQRYGAFFAGFEHPAQQLIMAECLAGAILFDDHHRGGFHDLIGGKALAALQALPSAADAFPFIGGAGIDNLAFGITAERTFHAGFLLISFFIL